MKRLLGLVASLTAALLLALPASMAPAQALPAWRTTDSSYTSAVHGTRLITDLRYATHAGFDRVVINLKGRIPSWKATYETKFYRDGSGALVRMRGGLQLVLMDSATHGTAGNSVYDGPRMARPGFDTLKAVALTGDFEGYVTFAFGLDPQHSPYRIFRLHDPQRLVIDFKH
jgi:hypothetical protein